MTKQLSSEFYRQRYWVRKHEGSKPALYAIHGLVSRYMSLLGFQPGEAVYLQMFESEENMAKKFGNWTMISARLSKDDKKKFHQAVEKSGLNAHDAVIELLGAGYKVSVSFVVDRESFVFTVTGPKDHKLNGEKSMTSWSDDLAEAMYMGWYKVRFVFGDGSWADDNDDVPWG